MQHLDGSGTPVLYIQDARLLKVKLDDECTVLPIPWPARTEASVCRFEPRRRHRCLSLISVVSYTDRGLCVGLITRPEESYWVRCVWVWSYSLVRRGGGSGIESKCHRKETIVLQNIKPRTTFVSRPKLQHLLVSLLSIENILDSGTSVLIEPSQI
jgi:hypothetical protein